MLMVGRFRSSKVEEEVRYVLSLDSEVEEEAARVSVTGMYSAYQCLNLRDECQSPPVTF